VQPAQRDLIGIGIGIGIEKDMTSGREKPDVYWADVSWVLPLKNMNQTSFWLNG
jgi:hypothetical protein